MVWVRICILIFVIKQIFRCLVLSRRSDRFFTSLLIYFLIFRLKQASREWNHLLDRVLRSFGLVPATADRCFYILRDASGTPVLLLCVLVDDMLAAFPRGHAHVLDALVQHIASHVNKPSDVKNLGVAEGFAGIVITRDRAKRTISLSQPKLLDKLRTAANQGNFQTSKNETTRYESPGLANRTLNRRDCPEPGSQAQKKMQRVPYREIAGLLLYISIMTRPEI